MVYQEDNVFTFYGKFFILLLHFYFLKNVFSWIASGTRLNPDGHYQNIYDARWDYFPTFYNTAPAESVAGVSTTSTALDREQDAEIAALQAENLYNPETFSHNNKPVDIRYHRIGKTNQFQKYYRTEFRSILKAPVTYR